MTYEYREKRAGEEAAEELTNFLNRASNVALEAFAEKLAHGTHRTLQQLAFGLFLKCIVRWAQPGNYDARNEATHFTCKRIVEHIGEDTYLPFI